MQRLAWDTVHTTNVGSTQNDLMIKIWLIFDGASRTPMVTSTLNLGAEVAHARPGQILSSARPQLVWLGTL